MHFAALRRCPVHTLVVATLLVGALLIRTRCVGRWLASLGLHCRRRRSASLWLRCDGLCLSALVLELPLRDGVARLIAVVARLNGCLLYRLRISRA